MYLEQAIVVSADGPAEEYRRTRKTLINMVTDGRVVRPLERVSEGLRTQAS